MSAFSTPDPSTDETVALPTLQPFDPTTIGTPDPGPQFEDPSPFNSSGVPTEIADGPEEHDPEELQPPETEVLPDAY